MLVTDFCPFDVTNITFFISSASRDLFDRFKNHFKLMLFSGNLNFQQNPLLAMSILKGDNTSELSKLALLNGNNPNGLNEMLGLEGYSGFGKK